MEKSGYYCVYCHEFPNGKRYIGITNNIKSRWISNGEKYKKQFVYKAIQKYGWDNIKHTILESDLSASEAKKREQYYISKYDTTVNGYNRTIGGDTLRKTYLNPKLIEYVRARIEYLQLSHFTEAEMEPLIEYMIYKTWRSKKWCEHWNWVFESIIPIFELGVNERLPDLHEPGEVRDLFFEMKKFQYFAIIAENDSVTQEELKEIAKEFRDYSLIKDYFCPRISGKGDEKNIYDKYRDLYEGGLAKLERVNKQRDLGKGGYVCLNSL